MKTRTLAWDVNISPQRSRGAEKRPSASLRLCGEIYLRTTTITSKEGKNIYAKGLLLVSPFEPLELIEPIELFGL